MILVDTGPLVALFAPRDPDHSRCRSALQGFREPLTTTTPVLTEASHLLVPGSRAVQRLAEFVGRGGLAVWFLDDEALRRSFQLMADCADHPMDLADASLVAAAEALRTTKVWTLDRNDFETYRARWGRTPRSFTLVP